MQWAVVLFWVSVGAIMATNALYPGVLWLLAKLLKPSRKELAAAEQPSVAVLIPVHNAQGSIRDKIANLYQTAYPHHLLEVWVGCDGCSDDTARKVAESQRKYPGLYVLAQTERAGKAAMLNRLAAQAQAPILLLTDVSAKLQPETLSKLVQCFADPAVGVASATPYTAGDQTKGDTEQLYTRAEAGLKQWETDVLGTTIGVFGPCYALRREAFTQLPANTLADDFFIALSAAQNGWRVVQAAGAQVRQLPAASIYLEARRRIRIGAGNWQNLARFANVLWQDNFRLSVAFFFHKVLRWLTPFFLLAALVTSGLLAKGSSMFTDIYSFAWVMQQLGLMLALLALLEVKWLRTNPIGHFYILNGALLLGFIKWLRGVRSGVWQPTPRTTDAVKK